MTKQIELAPNMLRVYRGESTKPKYISALVHHLRVRADMVDQSPYLHFDFFCTLFHTIKSSTDCSPQQANAAAEGVMKQMFGVDITLEPQYENHLKQLNGATQ